MNRRMTLVFGAAVAIVLFALMGLTISNTDPWTTEGTDANVTAANDRPAVVDSLFDTQVIAFEVLGILLTAAMIGALVIARPLDAEEDASNYTVPTTQQVAESDKASDVAAHGMATPGRDAAQDADRKAAATEAGP